LRLIVVDELSKYVDSDRVGGDVPGPPGGLCCRELGLGDPQPAHGFGPGHAVASAAALRCFLFHAAEAVCLTETRVVGCPSRNHCRVSQRSQ